MNFTLFSNHLIYKNKYLFTITFLPQLIKKNATDLDIMLLTFRNIAMKKIECLLCSTFLTYLDYNSATDHDLRPHVL